MIVFNPCILEDGLHIDSPGMEGIPNAYLLPGRMIAHFRQKSPPPLSRVSCDKASDPWKKDIQQMFTFTNTCRDPEYEKKAWVKIVDRQRYFYKCFIPRLLDVSSKTRIITCLQQTSSLQASCLLNTDILRWLECRLFTSLSCLFLRSSFPVKASTNQLMSFHFEHQAWLSSKAQ